jgi:hypothetical protein
MKSIHPGISSFFILILLLTVQSVCSGSSFGDKNLKGDSLQTHSDTSHVKPKHHLTCKPTTDFDQRFSFIRNQSVNIWGQRGGVLFNDELKVGLGAYYMDDTKMKSTRITSVTGIPQRYLTQSLIFGTAYIEPYILRRKYWELSVPFELGYGKSSSKFYETSDDAFVRSKSKDFLPAGAGLSLSFKLPALPHFKPLSWVGINFLAGYRYCLLENVFKTDYDGAFWSISGAIFLDRASDDIKAWKLKRKMENL